MDEVQANNKHVLLSKLGSRPYFLDVREKKSTGGLTVLVDKQFDKKFLGDVILKQCKGNDTSFNVVASIDQYLYWFEDDVTSNYTGSFIEVQQKIQASLKNKFGKSDLYPGVKILERGKSLTVIEFVHKSADVLHLFKISASRAKEKRKIKGLKQGLGFFKRHFWHDFSLAKCYVAYYPDNLAEFELKIDERYSGPRRFKKR